ncbi:hypothetical protein FB451DRAFT_1563041 [Mycena latifolia]|nr:hypothetical protein FB451DRAFT_1563041 [Mycena latifolia]
MSQWCQESCLACDRLVDGPSSYCSPACQAAMYVDEPFDDSDDDLDDPAYATWHRVNLWVHAVSPTPPLQTPVYTSPSKRILSPPHPTACLTSDSPASTTPHPSPPRPARTSPTATESLVASSTGPASPLSLGSLVRSWAPRTHLPRLTTANFTVWAKGQPTAALPPPLPSDETTSDGDVSPVWWHPTPVPVSPAPRDAVSRRPPAPRGRKLARAAA